jgi:hypothetical protein
MKARMNHHPLPDLSRFFSHVVYQVGSRHYPNRPLFSVFFLYDNNPVNLVIDEQTRHFAEPVFQRHDHHIPTHVIFNTLRCPILTGFEMRPDQIGARDNTQQISFIVQNYQGADVLVGHPPGSA